jgi:RNase adapter protein RapZ
MPVTITSFGYKYGVPMEADWIVDARFLENPYYIEELRPLTGRDAKIRDFVLGSPLTVPFLERTAALVGDLLAGYREWGKPSLFVAIGCTGGRHRSVVLAEELGRRLGLMGADVSVRHRDLAG